MSQFPSCPRRRTTVVIENLEIRRLLSAGAASVAKPNLNRLEAQPRLHVQPAVTNSKPTGITPTQARHAYGFDNISFSGGPSIGSW